MDELAGALAGLVAVFAVDKLFGGKAAVYVFAAMLALFLILGGMDIFHGEGFLQYLGKFFNI